MRTKIKELVTIFLVQLVLTIPFYTVNVYALSISNVKVTKVTSNSAVIEWNTDEISNGKVKYGKTTSLGFTQRHDNFIDNHTVTLVNGIESDTTYLFIVESTNVNGTTITDNNSNKFYTFKTNDITPPPQVEGLKVASITSDSVFLTWDSLNVPDLNYYVVYRNKIPIFNTSNTFFNDTNLVSDAQLIYKVSAVDNSGNEGPLSDGVIAITQVVDLIAPVISNVDVLPLTDTSAKVTWITDENSTTIVLYGLNRTDKTKSSDKLEINHSIVIDGLTKELTYILTIKSCDKSNNCANSTNHSFIARKDITLPFINLSIPKCSNRRVIDIVGSTEPFAKVTLFVNDMNIPKRLLNNNEVGKSGKFIFRQVQLEQSNAIKIVMEDKSGNKNEKAFDVKIDTEHPIVKLNEIPSLTSKSNVSIGGTVSEPVIIKVFADSFVNESPVPSEITGLNATKIGKNSVELRWNESEDKDFSHYAVFRDGTAIAITKPTNFNFFIDVLVDSGKTYTYEVSAVNNFANEGQKSEPITVTILQGGETLNIKPPPVDIFEDFRKPLLVANASDKFEFGVKLNKGDGKYQIKATFEDCADNVVVIQNDVALDTKKPDVKILSPPAGATIFENVANEVDIIGKTKPNARVHLFVDRTPFSSFDKSVEITTGLPNDILADQRARLEVEIRDLPFKLANTSITDDKLDAKCSSGVSATFCPSGADFSVTADEQGNFKFEKVDLTVLFGGAVRLGLVSPTNLRDTVLNPESRESKQVHLVVIATDQSGLRGAKTQNIRIGTCWSGNQSWDIIPLTQHQTPTLLSTERLREGTEEVRFYFNYSYIGPGTGARIQGVSISKACSAKEVLDPRFNISCMIMPAGAGARPLNPPDNTVTYTAMPLARMSGLDRFLAAEWKSFFKAINNEFTFPLKVTIRYQHDLDGDGKLESDVQTTCEQVSYVVDSSIIDFRKVMPDWLLFDFVDFLQNSIKTLDDVQKQVNKLLEFVAVGCVSSFGLSLVLGIYRKWVTFFNERAYTAIKEVKGVWNALDVFQKNPLRTAGNDEKEKEDCQKIIETIAKEKKGFKMKYMTDSDLKKCFPSSSAAWNAEAKAYQLMRWSCDRVFGHAAPSRWTESKSDEQIYNKIQLGDRCAVDRSVIGQVLTADKCTEFARKYPKYRRAAEEKGQDLKCVLKQTGPKSEAVYSISPTDKIPGSDKLYKMTVVDGPRGQNEYAIQETDVRYLTAQTKTCAEICGIRQGQGETTTFQALGESEPLTVTVQEPKADLTKKPKAGVAKPMAGCTTVNNCISFNANKEVFVKGERQKVEYAYTRGFTSDCFYNPSLGDVSVVSDSPAERRECCCINTKKVGPDVYYQPTDVVFYNLDNQVHESKKSAELIEGKPKLARDEYADMKWSYRYFKEKFEALDATDTTKKHFEYNPNRYIGGRDLPACFGFNNLFYQAKGKAEDVVKVDPFRQHEAAFQCAHISGISNRIQFLKNLMTAFSTCLIQVRTTGRGDAGVCKELFTQYVCGSIWQAVRFFVDGCIPTGFGTDAEIPTDYVDYVRGGFKGIYEGISDLQSTITQEYANVKLQELLGTGEESIARKICLGAFGYDWELSVKSFIDAAYATPFATLVQAITRSREFLAVEPGTFKPKYEYRASWIINPGCDFERYDVYLTCVGRKQLDKYPNNVDCSAIGSPSVAYTGQFPGTGPSVGYTQCDCIGLDNEKVGPRVFSGKIKQNILEDRAIPPGQRVVTSDVRYDHLKIVLIPDRRIKGAMKQNCLPTGYDEGIFYFPLTDKTARDILDCRADPLSGTYTCGQGEIFGAKKGTASFIDLKINGVDSFKTSDLVFSAGEPLEIDATIRNVGTDKCLKVSLDSETQAIIVKEGINQYQVLIARSLTTGLLSEVQTLPLGLPVELGDRTNSKDVSISLVFYDTSKNDAIDFDKDLIEIDKEFIRGEELQAGKKTITKQLDTIELSLEGTKLKINKNGAEIGLGGIEIVRSSTDGKPLTRKAPSGEDVAYATALIRVTTPRLVTPTISPSQSKQLVVGLYHIRDNVETSEEDISNCNFNERVFTTGNAPQERRITIRVEQKPTDTSRQGAIVSGRIVRPQIVKDENEVKITVNVVGNNRDLPVLLNCQPNVNTLQASPDSINSNIYTFRIPRNEFSAAGKYSCIITAESKNIQAKPTTDKFDFEVMCGGEGGNYGLCDKEGKCCKDGDCVKNSQVSGLLCHNQVSAVDGIISEIA